MSRCHSVVSLGFKALIITEYRQEFKPTSISLLRVNASLTIAHRTFSLLPLDVNYQLNY